MDWFLKTTVISNWIILIYWLVLCGAIILIYYFGLRYHSVKINKEIEERKKLSDEDKTKSI